MTEEKPVTVLWDGRPIEQLSLTELRGAFVEVSLAYSELAGDFESSRQDRKVIELVSTGYCYKAFDKAARERFRERKVGSHAPVLESTTDLGGH